MFNPALPSYFRLTAPPVKAGTVELPAAPSPKYIAPFVGCVNILAIILIYKIIDY